MDDKLRLDLHTALDAAIGPMPPASRFLSCLPSARRRTRLRVARPWVAGVATAVLLAAVLAAPRLIGTSRPTDARPPTANLPNSVIGGFGPNSTETSGPVTSTAQPSASPTPQGSSATVADYAACRAGDIEVSLATDQPGYRQGETVTIVFTERNTSGHPCYLPSGYGVEIRDSSGAIVYGFAMASAMAEPANPGRASSPPPTTLTEQVQWNQHMYTCNPSCNSDKQVPPGTYTVRYQTGDVARTCTVTITADPTPTPAPPTPTPLLPLPT